MSIRLDRIDASVGIVDGNGKPSPQFQRLWQKTVETIEGALNNIRQILVDLGLVTVTANDGLALAESAIKPGGEIKDDKVGTTSVQAGAISSVDVELQVGTIHVTTNAEGDILTNTLDAVPTGATGVLVITSAYITDPNDQTVKATFRLYRRASPVDAWVQLQETYQRYDGTVLLIYFDTLPADGVAYRTTYERDDEDFDIADGQIVCQYLKR